MGRGTRFAGAWKFRETSCAWPAFLPSRWTSNNGNTPAAGVLAAGLVIEADQYRTADEAKRALSQLKRSYGKDAGTARVNGHDAYFGTDGGKYALLAFTDGEEMGLMGAKQLDPGLISAKEGLCFDTSENVGTVTIAAPTYLRYEIEVLGRAAHSGIAPEKGLNAISLAAEIVRGVERGTYLIIPGFISKVYARIKSLVPGLFFAIIDSDVAKARRQRLEAGGREPAEEPE